MLHLEMGFDPATLRGARSLARTTPVDAMEFGPGSVIVRFADRGAHSARITAAALGADQRREMVAIAAAKPALLAGVLVGELPAAYDAHWVEAGVSLVPSAAELSLDCSCDDWGERCRHLAALGEMIAEVLGDDPYLLLTLRSWGREPFVDALRRARADATGVDYVRSEQPRGDDPGVDAERRFARSPAPLPALRPVPRRPGTTRSLPLAPADAGIDRSDIEALIGDAAQRATATLATGAVTGLHLDLDEDIARRAALHLEDQPALERLAASIGHDPDALEARAIAWNVGGVAGLHVSDRSWPAPAPDLEPGQRALGGKTRTSANVVFGGDAQLRLDPDGRWWRFRADQRLGWVLESGGLDDPEDL
ncbi:MAG: hypothetical protein R2710_11960 [Acidimicrobiales bacterium]